MGVREVIDFNEVRKAAENATKGEWKHYTLPETDPKEILLYIEKCVLSGEGKFHWIEGKHPDGGDANLAHVGNGPTSEANSRHIVWSQPANVLVILDALTKSQERVKVLEEALRKHGKHSKLCALKCGFDYCNCGLRDVLDPKDQETK